MFLGENACLVPTHKHILENIHALLDFNNVSKITEERIVYFSKTFDLNHQESQKLLAGEQVPSKTLLKRIADKFEVDHFWILQN